MGGGADTLGSTGMVEAEARSLAARVDELGAWVRSTVGALAGLVEDQLGGSTPRRSDLDLEARCLSLIEQRELPLAGAGFVAQTGVLVDAPYWLEWWTADPELGVESCRKLAADTDPASVGFRDYTELPWFVTPRETRTLHVTGPYVDYVCTDQHTLTVTQPVLVDDVFLGVAGVDVLAATVERVLRDPLDTASGALVVVNRAGRVVASSDPERVVGDLVRGLPDLPWFSGHRPGRGDDGLPWGFVACSSIPLGVLSRA